MSAHLEKVLRHAEKKLIKAVELGNKDSLDIYRDFLKLEEHRLYLAHKAGEGGLNFVRKRAATVDVVLRHIWQTALQSVSKENGGAFHPHSLVMVAVGGFGRQELCPYSDVDLLFVCDESLRSLKNSGILKSIIEKILYVLWDVGFKVGHASRTLEEVVEEANADLRTKTALLDARLIVGSDELYQNFQINFQKYCIENKQEEYIAWRIKDQSERHRKYGNTVHVQEPHLKNGCGGLRDYQNLLWVAKVRKGLHSTSSLQGAGWISKSERKKIDQAYDLSLRIRNELHYQQKRAEDILTLKMQGQIANAFQYPQKNILRRTEAFMRDYYQPARDIFQITNLLVRRLADCPQKEVNKYWSFLKLQKEESKKIDGFVLKNHELHAESRNVLSDPQKIMRAFQIMQQYDADLSPDLETFIRSRVNTMIPKSFWTPKVREIFFDLLRKKGKVGRILREMHEIGLLGKMIPEFEPLTCLVQHEFFHVYTADEHTLVCLEQLDKIIDSTDSLFIKYRELFLGCDQVEILYLTLVLHDVGKVKNSPHHNEISAQLAGRFAKRNKLNSHQMQNLLFLVYHHSTLSEFAQRRNLEELETIREFARIVQTQERLDMLMLITFADAQGTSGGAGMNWSGWKELLVWNLYFQTRSMLQGEEEFLRKKEQVCKEVVQNVKKLVHKDILEGETMLHFDLLPKSYINCTDDRIMVLHINLVHHFLKQAIASNENILKPFVEWVDRPQAGYSEVIIVTWDRERLFSKITGAFAMAELNILSADIFTREDNIVVDTFRVCTPRHEAVSNKIDRRCFEETLTQSLLNPNFDLKKEIAQKRSNIYSPLEGAEFPTLLRLDNDTSGKYTLLHLQTPDRIGLLFDVTSCFVDYHLIVSHSRITTEKGAALDTFYLSLQEGGKIMESHVQDQLLESLKNILSTRHCAIS